MSELSALEARLETALAAIQSALHGRAAPEGAAAPSDARLADLESENRRLSEELSKLQARRQQDVADLDALLARLSPLIEEA